jgi:hypothetical protein
VLASGSTEAKEGRAERRADHAARVRPGSGTVSADGRERGRAHVGDGEEWLAEYQAETN